MGNNSLINTIQQNNIQVINNEIEQKLKKIKSIDVCMIVDCTHSMGNILQQCKLKLKQIIDQIKNSQKLSLRVAFIGYRDYKKDFMDSDQYELYNFTTNVNEILEFIKPIKAVGGNDICEDVNGAIQQALKLNWQSFTKLLIHFTDAPPHGKDYHDFGHQQDDYFQMHPKDIPFQILFRQMVAMKIKYVLVSCINQDGFCDTAKMIDMFQRHYIEIGKTALKYFQIKKLQDAPYEFQQLLFNNIEQTVTDNMARFSKKYNIQNNSQQETEKIEGKLFTIDGNNKETQQQNNNQICKSINQNMQFINEAELKLFQSHKQQIIDINQKKYIISQNHNYEENMIIEEDDRESDSLNDQEELINIHQNIQYLNQQDILAQKGYIKFPSLYQQEFNNFWEIINNLQQFALDQNEFNIKQLTGENEINLIEIGQSNILEINFPAFASGSFNRAYYGILYQNEQQKIQNKYQKVCIKISKNERSAEINYFKQKLLIQNICNNFARNYNLLLENKKCLFHGINFTQISVAKEKFSNLYFVIEDFLEGKYQKYTNNAFYINQKHLNADDEILAFSHFTYDFSGGFLMITDLQGVGKILTDAAIHTSNFSFLGHGDAGYQGMIMHFKVHECNKICKKLQLKKFKSQGNFAFINKMQCMQLNQFSRCQNIFCGAEVKLGFQFCLDHAKQADKIEQLICRHCKDSYYDKPYLYIFKGKRVPDICSQCILGCQSAHLKNAANKKILEIIRPIPFPKQQEMINEKLDKEIIKINDKLNDSNQINQFLQELQKNQINIDLLELEK